MSLYSDSIRPDELYHFGVKGMRWGVRRYQNYDGSYTKRGLARFKKASDRYDRRDADYKQAKANLKSKKGTSDYSMAKSSVKRAKADRKMAKRKMESAYKSLKMDKKADQGKNLYRSGKTITGNDKVANTMGSLGGFGLSLAYVLNNNGQKDYAKIVGAASIGLGVASAAKYMHNEYSAKRLRAYYAGGGHYRD